uniref:Protein kinase domain-containing protein n=1 Tax=Setaria digitata TaxID=48799 RepID=A0A915PIB0_9BILA
MVIFTTLPPGTSNDDGRILVDESDYEGVDDEQLPFEIKDVVRIRANEKFSKCYDCMDEIGEGKFGKVYRCREKATGLELAAKRIKIKRDADREKVEREVAIMTRLRHPRIAQIYDAFATPDNDVVLVMEIVNGGELFDRVVDENYILTELAVVMIVRQLCEAISYIHSKNVVHLDIKPENIMCVSQTGNRIKLIDFGLAQFYDGSSNLLFMAGTPEFVAPEVIKFEPIDFYTDMWSIGVITYILLSGISPFLGETLGDTYVAVEKGEWEFDDEAFQGISDAAKDFISKLLIMDQKQRMLPEDCLHHSWIVDSRTKAANDLMLNQVSNGTPLSKEGLKYYLRNKRFRKATWALVFLIRFKRQTLMNFGKRKIPDEFIMAKVYDSLPIPVKEITGSCIESESNANVKAEFTLDGQKTEQMLPNISNVIGEVFDTTRTELVAAAKHPEEKKLSSEIPKKKPKSSANDEGKKKMRSSDEEKTKTEGKKHRDKNSEKSDEISCKPKKVSKHLKPLTDYLESQMRTNKAVAEHYEVTDSKKLPAEMCEVCITLETAKPVVSCTEILKPVCAAESVHLRSMTSELARTSKDEAKKVKPKKSCGLPFVNRMQESVRHNSSVNKLSEINKKGNSVAAILSMFTERAEQEGKCFEHRPSRPVRTFRDVNKSSSRKSSLVLNHENEANCVKLYRAPEEEKKRVKNLIELHRRGSADRKQVDAQEIVAVKQEEKSIKGFPPQTVNSTDESKVDMKERSNGKKIVVNPVLNATEWWENKVKILGVACPELNTSKNTPATEERSNKATTMTKTGDMKDERKILQKGVLEFKVGRKVMEENVRQPKSVVVVETLQIETLLTSQQKTTVQNDFVARSKGTRRGSQNSSSLNSLRLEEPKHPESDSDKITPQTNSKKSTLSSESRVSGKRHSTRKETRSTGCQDVLNRRENKIGKDTRNPSIRDGMQKLILPEKLTGYEDLPSDSAKKMKEKVKPLDTSHFPCKAKETKLTGKKGQIQQPISVLQSLSVDQVSTTKHADQTYESQQCRTPRKPPKPAGLSGQKKIINENKMKELEYGPGADTISSVVNFEKAVALVHNKVSNSVDEEASHCAEDTMTCDRDSMKVRPSPRSVMQDTIKRKVSRKSSCSKNLLIRMKSETNLADRAKKMPSNPTDTVRRKAVDDQAAFSNQTGQSQRSISIASLKNQENFSFGWLKLQLETRVNKEKEDQMTWRYRRDLEISPIQSGNAKKALNIWRTMEQNTAIRNIPEHNTGAWTCFFLKESHHDHYLPYACIDVSYIDNDLRNEVVNVTKGNREPSYSVVQSTSSDLVKMPEPLPNCAEGCVKPLLLTLRASFVSGNNYERLMNTCEKLREVYECMDRMKKCQSDYLFRLFMDGLKYICIEHPADCEQKCNAHKLIIGWFIYSAMQSTTFFHIDENGAPPRVNAFFFRKITSEACSILQCYFLCLKTKYNARCHGIGGNLLMEAILRPVYRIHNSILLSPLWNIMRLMMPSQCSFMMTDAGIAWQRVDPKLDQDLKEFYKNRTEPLVRFYYLLIWGTVLLSIIKMTRHGLNAPNCEYDKLSGGNTAIALPEVPSGRNHIYNRRL